MPYSKKIKLTRGEIAELVATRRLWYNYLTKKDLKPGELDVALDTMQATYARIFEGRPSEEHNALRGFIDPLCKWTDMDSGTIAQLCLLFVDPIEED